MSEEQPLRWPVSLLWPSGERDSSTGALNSASAIDLSLDIIVRALDVDHRHDRAIRAILCDLVTDPATISYRQDVLDDLRSLPDLADELGLTLPALYALSTHGSTNWPGDSPLGPVVGRLRELEHYVDCLDRLSAILGRADGIRSSGLRALRSGLAALAEEPDIVALREQLPELQAMIGQATSVTIGVNLGADLMPDSATIVELNRFEFKGPRSLLGRLLPSASGRSGITPLHHAGAPPLRRDSPLFRDLQHLLEAVTAPLGRALVRFKEINVAPLVALEGELAFYLGAVALASRLTAAGVTLCRPEHAAASEHIFVVEEMTNLALAIQMLEAERGSRRAVSSMAPSASAAAGSSALDGKLVASDAIIDHCTRFLVVTGPNRGGKTTYCRAVGQAQVLYQAGLFVGGAAARISPVDGIWTHFPLPELDRPGAGRLDEEVRRLRQIFGEAGALSLILLNEPLTSTSERDALVIATDVVRALQMPGARGVLVTHLHELALSIPQLNANGPPDGRITSMVAEVVAEGTSSRGTFRIVPGVPAGRSYAAEIARQHGLTFDQLQALLVARQVVPEPAAD